MRWQLCGILACTRTFFAVVLLYPPAHLMRHINDINDFNQQQTIKGNRPQDIFSMTGSGSKYPKNYARARATTGVGGFDIQHEGKNATKAELLSTAAVPALSQVLKSALFAGVITLYVLNQQHMLPKSLSSIVSKALFWPTLPITVLRRIGKWETLIDDSVVLGGAPFLPTMPKMLYEEYDVRGVVNMCDEYRGPVALYDRLGMKHIRLRTVDHFEPTFEQLQEAVAFIQHYKAEGTRVYVHCRAGHGRSAAVAFAWLLYNYPNVDPQQLNEELCQVRNVRRYLWKQPNICQFAEWVRMGGKVNASNHPSSRGGASQSHLGSRLNNRSMLNEKSPPKIRRQNMGDWDYLMTDSEGEGYYFDEDYDSDESDYQMGSTSDDDLDYEMWKRHQQQQNQ